MDAKVIVLPDPAINATRVPAQALPANRASVFGGQEDVEIRLIVGSGKVR